MCLDVFTPMFETVTVNTGRGMQRRGCGRVYQCDRLPPTTSCAEKGLPFRDAYKSSARSSRTALRTTPILSGFRSRRTGEFCPKFGEDIYAAVGRAACAALRKRAGGPWARVGQAADGKPARVHRREEAEA